MGRVLIGCEESGVVREAFRELGHDAWSCDLIPARDGSIYHLQQDVREVLGLGWDLGVFHPPCTHLAVSGARWFREKRLEQEEALEFVRLLLDAPIPRSALENPVSIISTRIRKPDFITQPWQHGDPYQKTTCFWLKNLPPLAPSDIVEGREQKCWRMGPSPDRAKLRSETYPGIARSMATQWGSLL
jgi:hypothetical protein